jgi:hypothetical protein
MRLPQISSLISEITFELILEFISHIWYITSAFLVWRAIILAPTATILANDGRKALWLLRINGAPWKLNQIHFYSSYKYTAHAIILTRIQVQFAITVTA